MSQEEKPLLGEDGLTDDVREWETLIKKDIAEGYKENDLVTLSCGCVYRKKRVTTGVIFKNGTPKIQFTNYQPVTLCDKKHNTPPSLVHIPQAKKLHENTPKLFSSIPDEISENKKEKQIKECYCCW